MRQDLTRADRAWAGKYEAGNIVRYSDGSKTLGIPAGAYATVRRVDAKANELTVDADGKTVTYNPKRLHGVSVFTAEERSFAVGERVRSRSRFPTSGSPTASVPRSPPSAAARCACGWIRKSRVRGKGAVWVSR